MSDLRGWERKAASLEKLTREERRNIVHDEFDRINREWVKSPYCQVFMEFIQDTVLSSSEARVSSAVCMGIGSFECNYEDVEATGGEGEEEITGGEDEDGEDDELEDEGFEDGQPEHEGMETSTEEKEPEEADAEATKQVEKEWGEISASDPVAEAIKPGEKEWGEISASGSLEPERNFLREYLGGTSVNTSVYQLIVFETVLEAIKGRFVVWPITFQDPFFTATDREFLSNRGYEVLPNPPINADYGAAIDPVALNKISSSTFFFEAFLPARIGVEVLAKKQPSLVLGADPLIWITSWAAKQGPFWGIPESMMSLFYDYVTNHAFWSMESRSIFGISWCIDVMDKKELKKQKDRVNHSLDTAKFAAEDPGNDADISDNVKDEDSEVEKDLLEYEKRGVAGKGKDDASGNGGHDVPKIEKNEDAMDEG